MSSLIPTSFHAIPTVWDHQGVQSQILAIFGQFWPFLGAPGPKFGHPPPLQTGSKTSTWTSCNRFGPPECSRVLQPVRRSQQELMAPKRAILGNWGQKTAHQAAKWAYTGKPKIPRVTSGLGEVMIPLIRVRLRPKMWVIWA